MQCPNCDHVLNATGCQACGWKFGEAYTRNEEVFPFKIGGVYPDGIRRVLVIQGPVTIPATAVPEPAPSPAVAPPVAPRPAAQQSKKPVIQ
jgi:hypothetical protein